MREIELKPSRQLGLLLMGMALLALVAMSLAALPGSMQWVLGGVVVCLVGWGGWRASRMARLRIGADGQLQAPDETNEWRDVEVQRDSFVATGLIVLRYRLDGQRLHSLTLLSDSASADDLRRLRVSLRWIRRTRLDTSSRDAG
ncbi:MAG: hypothetical protein Q7T90_00360 [Thiobacillus sp.]|nr:hypothetical protein [Thiobacillus sp.]